MLRRFCSILQDAAPHRILCEQTLSRNLQVENIIMLMLRSFRSCLWGHVADGRITFLAKNNDELHCGLHRTSTSNFCQNSCGNRTWGPDMQWYAACTISEAGRCRQHIKSRRRCGLDSPERSKDRSFSPTSTKCNQQRENRWLDLLVVLAAVVLRGLSPKSGSPCPRTQRWCTSTYAGKEWWQVSVSLPFLLRQYHFNVSLSLAPFQHKFLKPGFTPQTSYWWLHWRSQDL